MSRWRTIGVVFLLYVCCMHASATLAGVPLERMIKNPRVPPRELKATAVSPHTVVLTWRPGTPLDMIWIKAEVWLAHQNMWTILNVMYVSNETARFEYNELQASTTYRYMVCGLVAEKSGKVSEPQYCSNQISIRTPVALDTRGSITLPMVFVIGGINPARTGFEVCAGLTGLTGLIGRYGYGGSGKIEPANWPNYSMCAPGNVTITQTNPKMNMLGKKIQLIVTRYGDYAEIYELAFPDQDRVTFQVVFSRASGYRSRDFPTDKAYATTQGGSRVNFAVYYERTKYVTISCFYSSSPIAMSCQ